MKLFAQVVRCGETRELNWNGQYPVFGEGTYFVEMELFGSMIKVMINRESYDKVRATLAENEVLEAKRLEIPPPVATVPAPPPLAIEAPSRNGIAAQ